jgi:hypothetical protein
MPNTITLNSSSYIPYDCVAPVMICDPEHPEFPYFSGTGFFARCPPFDQVFFVTGKHCVLDPTNRPRGDVQVACVPGADHGRRAPLEYLLTTSTGANEDDVEDIAVYVVGNPDPEDAPALARRALILPHQDTADVVLRMAVEGRTKLRTVGFPGTSKEIDYERRHAQARPRGLHGHVVACDEVGRWFEMQSLNWSEGGLSGFSGSPMLELALNARGEFEAIPVGVLLTGAIGKLRFISINVVTDLIAAYFVKHRQ